jgi:hypothetical protein
MGHFGSRLDVDTATAGVDLANKMVVDSDADLLFVTVDDGVEIWDISDPSNISRVAQLDIVNNIVPQALALDTTNSLLYVIEQSQRNFYCYDYSTPGSTTLRDSINTGAQTSSFGGALVINGDYAYITTMTFGGVRTTICIVNISDPDNLSMETTFTDATNLAGNSIGMATDGTYLYVSTASLFSVFTFSGASLVFNNKITLTTAGGSLQDTVRLASDYAYVSNPNNDLVAIIDISDPTAVSQTGELSDATYLNGVRDIQLTSDDKWLYGMNFFGTDFYVTVWDIETDPETPVREESIDITADAPWTTGRMGGFAVDGYDNLYAGRYTARDNYGVASYGIDATATPADTLILEAAFGDSLFETSPTWTDISAELKSLSAKRGRQHELGRVSAGEATFVMDNASGNWYRDNQSGAYYPDVKPLTLIRLGHTYDQTTRYLWWGYIEGVRPGWVAKGEAGYNPEATIDAVDMFKAFSRFSIQPANPAMTANAASGQKVVTVADVNFLYVGQSIKVYDDGASETNEIASIDTTALTVTMTTNLANSYRWKKGGALKKFPQGLTGTRINDVLRELAWPAAMSDVDAGQITVTEFTPATGGTNCLEHIQKMAELEGGNVFIRAADGFFEFQDLIARAVQPLSVSQATFNDDGTSSLYVHPELVDDETHVYNIAHITGDAINPVTLRDNTALAAQGPRIWSLKDADYALDSDALNRAWIHVARFAASKLRVASLLCKPQADTTDLYDVLFGNSLSARVTFNLDTTINPAEISQDYHIEGVELEYDASVDEWVVKWQLWDVNHYRIAYPAAGGWVENSVGATYALLHDAANGDVVYNDGDTADVPIYVGQWLVHALVGGAFTSGIIFRGLLEFDLSGLAADDSVAAATVMVKLYNAYAQSDGSWNLTLSDEDTVDTPLVVADYGTLEPGQTSFGSVAIDGSTGWVFITLNANGLSHLNPGGTTRFALRSDEDMASTNPGVNGNKRDYVVIYGQDSVSPPRLIVRIA